MLDDGRKNGAKMSEMSNRLQAEGARRMLTVTKSGVRVDTWSCIKRIIHGATFDQLNVIRLQRCGREPP